VEGPSGDTTERERDAWDNVYARGEATGPFFCKARFSIFRQLGHFEPSGAYAWNHGSKPNVDEISIRF
jgi:hypothetical protein